MDQIPELDLDKPLDEPVNEIEQLKKAVKSLKGKNKQLERKLAENRDLIIKITVNHLDKLRYLKYDTSNHINAIYATLQNTKKEILKLESSINLETTKRNDSHTNLWWFMVLITVAVIMRYLLN